MGPSWRWARTWRGYYRSVETRVSEELETDIEVAAENPLIIPTWNTKFDDPVLIIAYKVTLLTTPRKTDEVSNFSYFDIHEIKQEKLDSTLIGNLSKIYQIDR